MNFGDNIFKIQSLSKLTEESLNNYFNNFKIISHKDWEYAYPDLIVTEDKYLPDFIVDKNMYHLNGIEMAASCMEMSMISAKNIVNMIMSQPEETKADSEQGIKLDL